MLGSQRKQDLLIKRVKALAASLHLTKNTRTQTSQKAGEP